VGIWYYDEYAGIERVDAGNQLTCNGASPTGNATYCYTQLVDELALYVIFPFENYCCTSCTAATLTVQIA
jgi:hypothetical protein